MGIAYNPRVVTDGLVLTLDAGNTKSYPGSGTTWTDLSGQGKNGTLDNSVTYTSSHGGGLSFDGTDELVSLPKIITTSDFTVCQFITPISDTGEGWTFEQYNFGAGRLVINTASSYLRFFIGGTSITTNVTLTSNQPYFICCSRTGSTGKIYINGNLNVSGTLTSNALDDTTCSIGGSKSFSSAKQFIGYIYTTSVYNRALSAAEIQQNYNALRGRYEKGGLNNPFSSPTEARILGYTSGNYYFQSGSMSSPQLLEFERDYYENRGWVCVFRSPYRSTATTNKINLNIPMGGLLVQRDTLDLRAAVYWSTPITYNTVGGSGNNTADSGYSPRRVILGGSGGHGIYATNQSQCNWSTATGAIGAGWDGSTCGSFPNDLIWGTGRSNTATYENRSGVWSHWITWS